MLSNKVITATVLVLSLVIQVYSQGAYDLYSNFKGERKGSFTPGEIAGIIVASLAGVCALGITLFFCYYVYQKENNQGSGGRYSPAGYRRP